MKASRSPDAGKSKSGPAPRPEKTESPKSGDHDSPVLNPLWQRMTARVQTKLVVGAADDVYEREANQVADRISRMPDRQPANPIVGPGFDTVQRICPTCENHDHNGQTVSRLSLANPRPQRKCPDCENESTSSGSEPVGHASNQPLLQTWRLPSDEASSSIRRLLSADRPLPLRRQPEDTRVINRLRLQAATNAIRREAADDASEESWPQPADGEIAALESAGVTDEDEAGAADQSEDLSDQPAEEPPAVQKLRRKEAGREGGNVSDQALATRISSPTGGRALPDSLRSRMEGHFGSDFSGVRVHDSPQDQADAASLNSRAFAHRNHVWLARGESTSDTKLMAHELTHVVQQGGVSTPSTSPVQRAPATIQRAAGWVPSWVPDWIVKKADKYAHALPGYRLLTVALGTNPITGATVQRNATNIIRGILNLVPGAGEQWFQDLKKSGALEKAGKWFSAEIDKLDITWTGLKQLLEQAVSQLSLWKGFSGNWKILKNTFGPLIGRVIRFAKHVGKKILEFIFEGALHLAGPIGKRVLGVVKKAGATFGKIIADPIGFLGNLLASVKKGFSQFSTNILKHLKAGLMGWLFGTLSKAGIQIPQKFDLKGIVGLVLQILGITYDRVRAKLVKKFGEKRVAYIEKAVAFVKILVTEGIAGVWKKMLEYLGNLKDMVIGAIRNWVVTKIITAAVTKIVSLFNPASAIVQAVITIYNVVTWFIQRIEQILSLVTAVTNSIANIASGKLDQAANYVEKTMARTLPVIISFLASFMGLGGIADRIKGIIKGIQERVDKAIDKVIAFIIKKAKALWKKLKSAGKKVASAGLPKDPKKRLPLAMAAIKKATAALAGKRAPKAVMKTIMAAIKLRYGLKRLDVVKSGKKWAVLATINPESRDELPVLVADDITAGTLKILLLGEADFSFSVALARTEATNIRQRMIATAYEGDLDVLKKKYPNTAPTYLKELEEGDVQVVPGVDARSIGGKDYGSIVFNFPFMSHYLVDTDEGEKWETYRVQGPGVSKTLADHKDLIRDFLKSAAKAIHSVGKIFLTQKRYWASRFGFTTEYTSADPVLKHSGKKAFVAGNFPPYEHRITSRAGSAGRTHEGETHIYERQNQTPK